MSKKKAVVSVVKCNSYELKEVDFAVRKCLELIGGLGKFVNKGDKVLIKPNLLAPLKPEEAVTTHPTIVRVLVKLIEEIEATVWIGDSSGGTFAGLTSKSLDICGMNQIAEESTAEIKNFDTCGITVIPNQNRSIVEEFNVAKAAMEADVIISVPKLKIHELLLLTGAVKNLFGVIPGAAKRDVHAKAVRADQLSQAILDLYGTIRPKVSLMDAVIGLEGRKKIIEGAVMGNPREIGLILASTDAVALDTVAAFIMGYDPMKIGTIKLAQISGIGVGDINNITILGEDLEEIIIKDFAKASNYMLELLPKFLTKKFVDTYVSSKPFIDSSRCKRCELCRDSCPMRSIHLEPVPTIDYHSCIRCYCCYEVCVNNAIVLEKPWFSRYILRKKGIIY
jgi:uncharacterized protein (DUF362 family)/Pyruvate/2-oxoacid:ferredoxin oxidoreductase delta subunit